MMSSNLAVEEQREFYFLPETRLTWALRYEKSLVLHRATVRAKSLWELIADYLSGRR